jgi:protein O-mannosyl-transferase
LSEFLRRSLLVSAYNFFIPIRIHCKDTLLASSATAPGLENKSAPNPPSALLLVPGKYAAVLCLGLVLLVLVFYNPVVHNGFTNMDDNGYITENPHVKAGLSWTTVKWALRTADMANWHPLTWLSHALDCQLFGLNPIGHHYENVLIHAANALLLFWLLEVATGLTWPSFMVAALFALHPINVESVAWASERKNVLSMFFFLLAMHAYQRYVRKINVQSYALVAFLFALGLMAKPEIITFPFVLLLWDYWPLHRMFAGNANSELAGRETRRSFGYLFLEKAPLFLLCAGSAAITLIAQSRAEAVHRASLLVRLGNALVAYVRYLGKAFWPSHLCSIYPHQGRFLPAWEGVAAGLVLVLISWLVLWRRNQRYLAMGWFWFLGTLVPVIGLVQVGVQAMADRYAYLSFIGLFICVIWSVNEFVREESVPTAFLVAPAVLLLGTLGMLTRHQITYWHDSITLWNRALEVAPQNPFADNALGYALAQKGDVEAAIAHFDAAENMHYYGTVDLLSIAAYKRDHGHVREAVEEYGRAFALAPNPKLRSLVLSRVATVFLQIGEIAKARTIAEEAVKENPGNGSAWVAEGLIAESDGNFALAAERISQGMKVEPTDIGYLLLADAYGRAGQPDASQQAVKAAADISADIGTARKEAAEVLANAGIRFDTGADAAGLAPSGVSKN